MENSDKISYNEDNYNANTKWEIGGQEVSGEVIERIDLKEAPLITKPDCKHEKTTRTQSLEFEDCIEVKCDDCPVGWFLRGEV